MTPLTEISLSSRVREMTREDHQNAETSPFITELMGGERSARDYALLVSQYHFMYQALEQAAEKLRSTSDIAGIAELFDPALDRRAAIAQDLESLLPHNGLDVAPVQLEATAAYAAHLQEISDDAAKIAAHHYLRFLGDLSGGLAIARLVQRHYDIPNEQLNMYTFESIEKPKVYKDQYRDQLDRLDFTPEQQETFITEAGLGFAHNKAIFEDLGNYTSALV